MNFFFNCIAFWVWFIYVPTVPTHIIKLKRDYMFIEYVIFFSNYNYSVDGYRLRYQTKRKPNLCVCITSRKNYLTVFDEIWYSDNLAGPSWTYRILFTTIKCFILTEQKLDRAENIYKILYSLEKYFQDQKPNSKQTKLQTTFFKKVISKDWNSSVSISQSPLVGSVFYPIIGYNNKFIFPREPP